MGRGEGGVQAVEGEEGQRRVRGGSRMLQPLPLQPHLIFVQNATATATTPPSQPHLIFVQHATATVTTTPPHISAACYSHFYHANVTTPPHICAPLLLSHHHNPISYYYISTACNSHSHYNPTSYLGSLLQPLPLQPHLILAQHATATATTPGSTPPHICAACLRGVRCAACAPPVSQSAGSPPVLAG